MHGLNGDILVWNPVTKRRHELSSMGIRVTKDTLVEQMKIAGREDELSQPYHQMILNDEIPQSIGGGIGIIYKDSLASGSIDWWEKQAEQEPLTGNLPP